MFGTTTAIIHDKRIKRKDDKFAVKLRITHQREQKYFPLNVYLLPEEWEKTQSEKAKGDYKKHKLYFNKIEKKAIDIIDHLPQFSFQAFEKAFNQKTDKVKDVFYYFEAYLVSLKKENRSGTESSYRCALNSVKSFNDSKNRKNLPFSEITPEWLQSYENWMVKSGRSITSVGIYLRSLRTILNQAIEDGITTKEFYPFGKRKYVIPAGNNIKKALTIADVQKVVEYVPTTVAEEKAKDFWVLSYLCNGANMKDLALLKGTDVDDKRIVFVRAKTARTTKQNLKPIVVMMLPEIKAIIKKWGINKDNNGFLFGILELEDNSETQLKKVRHFIKTNNKYMKRIGVTLGFDLKLTSYSARHSFATVLKRSGAPIEFISESLGHKDLRTTESYLDSFEDDVKESFQKQLLNFSKT
nr:site-specific integrase [uncultured Pedobacter sp.]